MSENMLTTDAIKDMVRTRYGGIAARADFLVLRARSDIMLRDGWRTRSEHQGAGHRLYG